MRRVVVVCAVLGLVAFGLWLRGEFEIDRCLDAGGRRNDQSKSCETAATNGVHPQP